MLLAGGLWYVSGLPTAQFLKWLTGIIGGLATLLALLWSISNAVRRLLVASPVNARRSAPTSDPMRDLQRRYAFLMSLIGTPVVIVVHHLDRCRADYVVELLEGIQTLLKNSADPTPFVALIVPAARAWLCDSYLHVYEEFGDIAKEPGRPFGLRFLENVFDYALRVPSVPPAASLILDVKGTEDTCKSIREGSSEQAIRELIAHAEQGFATTHQSRRPLYNLRVAAVERLGELEVENEPKEPRLCVDTAAG